MPEPFVVRTDAFEGPLSLLLDLIESRKLLINDISLGAVTDAYIERVRTLQEDHIVETSQFVLIAATLLLIKSKSLLPSLPLTEEESVNMGELEYRLKLYQLYRTISRDIEERFGRTCSYEKVYTKDETPIFTPDRFTTQEALFGALNDVVLRLPKKVFRPHVSVKKVISLEEMILNIESRITKHFKLSFKELTKTQERTHVIVSFLAILELVKQGSVLAAQENHFDDIAIERGDVDVPRYL